MAEKETTLTMNGKSNPGFTSDEASLNQNGISAIGPTISKPMDQLKDPPESTKKSKSSKKAIDPETGKPERVVWANHIEFLMACIATSVGLGNVWRFPFIAYENGGGAFLIPYIIVLFLVGKPMYYLECVLGQFSSRNSVRVWKLAPAMRGVGYAQALSCSYILTYYMSIVGTCIFYLIMSFQAELPWTRCEPEWLECVPSHSDHNITITDESRSSAELYYVRTVLQRNGGLQYGLGAPVWYLTLCLFAGWIIVFTVVARGIKSTGKAAYFLALFPYVVMITLLITTLLLEGAGQGILFFITPQWGKLLELEVWYSAVTQVFYSLSVCTGAIVMFASYNGFKQNVYRDAMIVTTLDTFTSLLSGFTIFGILGNLALELDTDVASVVPGGGSGLAFVSYPDAVARTFLPQLFSVLFFLMMTVLGVGSGVALLSTINTVLLDTYPHVRTVYMSSLCCVIGFLLGLIYVTPGGQFVLTLVDHYGGTFLVLFSAISQTIGVCWIYGLENLCLDIEFMLGIKTSFFWRCCWAFITPGMMITVFIYAFASYEDVSFGEGYTFPPAALAAGYTMLAAGMLFVPSFILLTLWKNRKGTLKQVLKKSFHYAPSWGPRSTLYKQEWVQFRADAKQNLKDRRTTIPRHVWNILTGGYRRGIPTTH